MEDVPASKKPSLFVKWFSVNRVKKQRLEREIMALKTEFKNFDWPNTTTDTNESKRPQEEGKENSPDKNDKKQTKEEQDEAKKSFEEAILKAKLCAEKCDFEIAWGNYYDAEYILAKSMDLTQRQIKASLLLIESEKFKSGWRQKQINILLGKVCLETPYLVSTEKLKKAVAVRNDYYITQNHKINLHTISANILALAMSSIIAGILLIFYIWGIVSLFKPETNGLTEIESTNLYKVLFFSGMFGALGAGFSFAKTLFSYKVEASKIPDQLLSLAVTVLRFLIGASAAMIVLLLFGSGFLGGVFDKTVLKSPVTYIVFSFVAGFSERWVIKMLGLVTKEKEKE